MSRNELEVAFRVMETKMPHFFCIVVTCKLSNLALFPSSEQDRALPLSPHLPPSSSSFFFVCSIGCDDGVERRKGKEKKQKKLFPADLSSPTFCSVFARFSTFKKGLVVRRRHPPRRRAATDGALRVRLPSPRTHFSLHRRGSKTWDDTGRVSIEENGRGRNCLALLFYILPFLHRMEKGKGGQIKLPLPVCPALLSTPFPSSFLDPRLLHKSQVSPFAV